jgi:FkbM family methyltransferase
MFKQNLKRIRRRLFERFGSDRYSRPSLGNLDRKLEKYLNYRNGFFIEVGGNDGFNQSNTYYFERFRCWNGILVEAIPELYEECVKERARSKVFNCALISDDYQDTHVTMIYSNLRSLVKGAQKSDENDIKHAYDSKHLNNSGVKPYEINVPVRTLTSILDECNVQEIDLFSLDVEGYELNVLKGLDFNKYRPKYMLIEARFKDEIEEYISDLYIQIDQLSHHDFLYKLKS